MLPSGQKNLIFSKKWTILEVTSPIVSTVGCGRPFVAAFALSGNVRMRKNAYVYVDGFNLYYRLKKTSFKWLDLKLFLNACIDLDRYEIKKIKYFSARVKRSLIDPRKTTRQDTYLRAIQTIPEVEVILGQFKRRTVKGFLCNPSGKETEELVKIKKFEEKNSDVNIATHMVADGYENNYDCAILVSNDTDLTTPLRHVKYRLKKMVIVISPYSDIHVNLKKSSHYNKTLPTEDIFRDNQFPQKIEIGKQTIYCPQDWIDTKP